MPKRLRCSFKKLELKTLKHINSSGAYLDIKKLKMFKIPFNLPYSSHIGRSSINSADDIIALSSSNGFLLPSSFSFNLESSETFRRCGNIWIFHNNRPIQR